MALCDLGCLAKYSNEIMVWLMPIECFDCYTKVTILTYLFKGQYQKYYYDLYEIDYKYAIADKVNGEYCFVEVTEPPVYRIDENLVEICDSKAINLCGDKQTDFSFSWYKRTSELKCLGSIKNHCTNYVRNIVKAKSDEVVWTTFKDYACFIKGKGYTKGFVQHNLRAVNAYREKTVGMYLVNRYMNPLIKNFFLGYDVKVDEDAFALSEMLQWVWRLAIRENKPIKLYIPSKRMRSLLQNWIKTGEIFSDFSRQ